MTEHEAPRYTVEEFLAQRDLLKQDLRTAAEVQNAMLPKFPPIRYAAASIIYQPAAEVSGDMYDFILNREGELGVFVGDATGHGVAAALITMMIHLGLDTIRRDLPTDEILRRLNRLLAARATGRSVTGVMFRITQSGRLAITHAAHPTVIVVPARGGPFREFTKAGCALGHFSDEPVRYEEEVIQLQPGDRVLAYTDGVVEWRNAGGEPFGEERLRGCLAEPRPGSVEDLAALLRERLYGHAGLMRCHDDLTAVLLEYQGDGRN